VIPLLNEEMNDFLKERVVGTVRMEIDASVNQIIDEATTAIKQFDTLKDKEKIDHLKEENYDEGKGVTGVVKTLQALANGQVQEFYLTAKFDEIEYDENEVKEILNAYAPGEDGEEPDVKYPRDIADDMISRALESAERIRFIEDESLLEKVGGVGALLRYTMSANQN
jgi:peptide subunit release factor 1 (eRF1)